MYQSQIANAESSVESLRRWAEAETGMDLSGTRLPRLRDATERVLARQEPAADLARIMAQPRRRAAFRKQLTAELTVGESFFFRNANHFRALREHVIPHILNENAAERELRIWVAGCANGEEPYSLSILLDQMSNSNSPAIRRWQTQPGNQRVSILATDLNPGFLERARAGLYRDWSFRGTDIQHDPNYFHLEGREFRLNKSIRDRVRFAYLNLVKDVYPSPLTGTLGLDLILFRNVAIYLKKEVTRAIVQRFHRALRPGGWLLLGETEGGTALRDGFQVHRFGEATLLQKESTAGPINDDPLPMPEPLLPTVVPQPSLALAGEKPTDPSGEGWTVRPDWVPLPTTPNVAPTSKSASRTDLIHQFLQQQNFADAERTIDRIPRRKERAIARSQYVRGLLACAETTRARAMLDRCLDEEPLLTEAQLLKATFAEEDGDLVQAEEAYRRALYVDRKCTIAHFHLALVQNQNGNSTGARRSLRTAAELVGGEDLHKAVPYGDGVCHGRLKEMIEGIFDI